jgi:hypothetical protein
MNRQEAIAQFAADKAMLLQRGIVLPSSVKMYLPDEYKYDYGLAMDGLAMDVTAGPLVTDPNAAIPWMLTTTIDPEIIRVIFSPLAFADILGERRAGDWTEDTRMFPIVEQTGEVSSYGDFNNNGRAGVNINWPQFQSYLFQTMVRYGERQIARAGLAKISYVSELGLSAADLLNRFTNLSYAFGLQGLQNYGIINNPFLSAFLTPATKAGGGTAWFTGNTPNATANEVYNDIIALVTKLVAQTNGALDTNSPMTLALSPQSHIALTFANSFGVFVKDLLKEGYPNLKVKIAPQYGTQSSTNPQGYSTAGNAMQLIADKIQGQTVAYAAFNEKLRAHKIVAENSAWSQKTTSGTWGTILRSPQAVTGMLGI